LLYGQNIYQIKGNNKNETKDRKEEI